MPQIETPTDPEAAPEPLLFDLIDHFCRHIKLSAGASTSAANTAESYANALKIFKRFIRHAYSRKRGFKAPYPVRILDSDILLAYHDWLSKTPPGRVRRASESASQRDSETASQQIAGADMVAPPAPAWAGPGPPPGGAGGNWGVFWGGRTCFGGGGF